MVGGLVDRDNISLADEARTAIGRSSGLGASRPMAAGVERIRAARRRFLPYLVVGGAIVCSYLSLPVADKDDVGLVVGAGVSAGIVAGTIVGWVLLTLYQRRVERWAVGRRRINLAIVLLTVPAYVVAGWVCAWIGWIVVVASSQLRPELGPPNAWGLLIWGAVVIYPLSYVFARRDLDRPDSFIGAVRSARNELHEVPSSALVLGDFLIAFAWFIGALFVSFAVIIGVQILVPSLQLDDAFAPWIIVAFLVAWVGLTVVGTTRTLRWVHRRRARTP